MTGNSTTENAPLKRREWQELKQFQFFYSRSDVFFSISLLPAYHLTVNFFIHNSHFPASSDSRWLSKLVLHGCKGDFLYFDLFPANDDTLTAIPDWGRRKIPAFCPLLGLTVKKQNKKNTKSLITNTHTDSLKYKLLKSSHLCTKVYMHTNSVI